MWENFARNWLVNVILLVIAIGTATFNQHFAVVAILAITIFMIGAINGLYIDSKVVIEDLRKHFEEKLENLNDRIDAQNLSIRVFRTSHRLKGPLGKVLTKVHEDGKNTLTVQGDHFIIRNHSTALQSYVNFWEHLVEVQDEIKKKNFVLEANEPKLANLTALVVHRSAIKIWEHSALEPLFAKQGEFIENGGTIKRILWGEEESPTEDYVEIAKRMAAVDIQVFYSSSEKRDHPDYVWDFLVIKEMKQAVIWDPVNSDGEITSAIFTSDLIYRNKSLINMWERIEQNYSIRLGVDGLPERAQTA